jgi:hypothetical protein
MGHMDKYPVRLKTRAEKELAGLAEERCVPVKQDAAMIDIHPSYIERRYGRPA